MQICRILLYIRVNAEYNKAMVKIKNDRIWQYIQENNYTLKQFCSLVGVSRRELNKILSGNLNFKFVSLFKLANFFQVPISWLLDDGKVEVQTEYYL